MAHVTRREFYGALGVLWLYMTFVIGDLLRIEWRWSTAIQGAMALMMTLVYAVISYNRSQKSVPAHLPALSERVKEIARDPARKIEAIKVYREETGTSLVDAKEAVEAFIDGR